MFSGWQSGLGQGQLSRASFGLLEAEHCLKKISYQRGPILTSKKDFKVICNSGVKVSPADKAIRETGVTNRALRHRRPTFGIIRKSAAELQIGLQDCVNMTL